MISITYYDLIIMCVMKISESCFKSPLMLSIRLCPNMTNENLNKRYTTEIIIVNL